MVCTTVLAAPPTPPRPAAALTSDPDDLVALCDGRVAVGGICRPTMVCRCGAGKSASAAVDIGRCPG
ncbi:hypothetical protein; putative signal peptide [Frankia alni ACN14a]|uniref:Uncharacterized protein n=1 Tax=Frankia alni (strain DSM 45986 / CECT 9034 / ACN14a) TaxID=326424 RepID=Q0RAU2_FRAAA|nr:hypothetical protein; putative signal peptide [Frankia alni ACN14a]